MPLIPLQIGLPFLLFSCHSWTLPYWIQCSLLFFFLYHKATLVYNQVNNHSGLCALGGAGAWAESGKYSWISFSQIFFISCLLGSWTHLHGNSEKFFGWKSKSLPGHSRRKTGALSPDKTAGRGQALVLYSLRTPRAKTVSIMPRLYKLRDVAEEVFTALYVCSLDTFPSSCYNLNSLWDFIWTERLFPHCFFAPWIPLISQANSVFIDSFLLTLLLSRGLNSQHVISTLNWNFLQYVRLKQLSWTGSMSHYNIDLQCFSRGLHTPQYP